MREEGEVKSWRDWAVRKLESMFFGREDEEKCSVLLFHKENTTILAGDLPATCGKRCNGSREILDPQEYLLVCVRGYNNILLQEPNLLRLSNVSRLRSKVGQPVGEGSLASWKRGGVTMAGEITRSLRDSRSHLLLL